MSTTQKGGYASSVSCGIAVMAKASIPGRAKTRLVPPLTSAEAADLNTAFLRDVADNIGRPHARRRSAVMPHSGRPSPRASSRRCFASIA